MPSKLVHTTSEMQSRALARFGGLGGAVRCPERAKAHDYFVRRKLPRVKGTVQETAGGSRKAKGAAVRGTRGKVRGGMLKRKPGNWRGAWVAVVSGRGGVGWRRLERGESVEFAANAGTKDSGEAMQRVLTNAAVCGHPQALGGMDWATAQSVPAGDGFGLGKKPNEKLARFSL